jgi:hypothetical protein
MRTKKTTNVRGRGMKVQLKEVIKECVGEVKDGGRGGQLLVENDGVLRHASNALAVLLEKEGNGDEDSGEATEEARRSDDGEAVVHLAGEEGESERGKEEEVSCGKAEKEDEAETYPAPKAERTTVLMASAEAAFLQSGGRARKEAKVSLCVEEKSRIDEKNVNPRRGKTPRIATSNAPQVHVQDVVKAREKDVEDAHSEENDRDDGDGDVDLGVRSGDEKEEGRGPHDGEDEKRRKAFLGCDH